MLALAKKSKRSREFNFEANDLALQLRVHIYNPAIFGDGYSAGSRVHRLESHSSRLARFPSLVVIVVVVVTVTVGGALV